ncbi:uncharacterized protein F5891DRAFT_1201049 [Suillus fuscotomentosus]|uniref:Uncharacterized protein n=1 Tax=Suillus fuscotomentosus TaxID=1912939 RepID=A0AAD4DNN4_9AGAM|nr:uncharacterized protein F5891DRAFT_1201049 [Suillus fuscotomentosus]KAG1886380.1 hypothetical protein F5891DRAFT_1201049 [Suillus fuscotomentosus]
MVVTPPKAKPQPYAQKLSPMETLTLVPGSDHFTMSSLAALHASPFAQGFSNNECQAAGRALFRHDMHIYGAHYHARKPGERTLTHVELVEAALQDIFDAVTMQDHIDGGISLLIQCPGSEVSSTALPEELALDLYITPHELQETPQCISGDVTTLVQAFAAEFVLPHLQHFSKCCAVEGIKPPKRFPAAHINTHGPQYLPAPMDAAGAHIQCSAQSPQAFSNDFEVQAQSKDSNQHPAAILSKALLADLQVQPEVVKYDLSYSVLTLILKVLGILVFSEYVCPSTLNLPSTALKFIYLFMQTMVSQSFHVVKSVSAGQRIQLPPCTCPKVVLSKEARAALIHSRQEKSRQFRDAFNDAWNQLDEATKTIAVSHHKSVCYVQNDLCYSHYMSPQLLNQPSATSHGNDTITGPLGLDDK